MDRFQGGDELIAFVTPNQNSALDSHGGFVPSTPHLRFYGQRVECLTRQKPGHKPLAYKIFSPLRADEEKVDQRLGSIGVWGN
jgi:hypothetical protein